MQPSPDAANHYIFAQAPNRSNEDSHQPEQCWAPAGQALGDKRERAEILKESMRLHMSAPSPFCERKAAPQGGWGVCSKVQCNDVLQIIKCYMSSKPRAPRATKSMPSLIVTTLQSTFPHQQVANRQAQHNTLQEHCPPRLISSCQTGHAHANWHAARGVGKHRRAFMCENRLECVPGL